MQIKSFNQSQNNALTSTQAMTNNFMVSGKNFQGSANKKADFNSSFISTGEVKQVNHSDFLKKSVSQPKTP